MCWWGQATFAYQASAELYQTIFKTLEHLPIVTHGYFYPWLKYKKRNIFPTNVDYNSNTGNVTIIPSLHTNKVALYFNFMLLLMKKKSKPNQVDITRS